MARKQFSKEYQPQRKRGKSLKGYLSECPREIQGEIRAMMLHALSFKNRDEAKQYLQAKADDLPQYGFVLQVVIYELCGKRGFSAVVELYKLFFGAAPIVTETIDGKEEQKSEMMGIARKYNSISSKYQQFFNDTRNERHVFLQGGRRSGKTFSTFLYLQYKAAFLNDGNTLNIMVVCFQFPQLQKTIADFTAAVGVEVRGSTTEGMIADTMGARWHFHYFDSKEKAQGTKCDILFINEAPNVLQEVAEVLMLGVRLQCFYNYNPTKKFWGTNYLNDKNLLCTTWRDNEYLTEEQRGEFEKLKERATHPKARKWDIAQYKIYYLGEFADLAGNVFGNIRKCSDDDFKAIPAEETIGLDFGFATDGDPTACVGVKLYGDTIYIKQYIYQRGLTSDEELDEMLNNCGINRHVEIHSDYGGNGRSRMDNLIRNYRRKMVNAIKGQIVDGLAMMLTFEGGIVITEYSLAAIDEFENYELDGKGTPKGDDHTIDAARYAFNYAIRKYKR